MRLRFELHLGYQQIGTKLRDLGEHVHKYLKRILRGMGGAFF